MVRRFQQRRLQRRLRQRRSDFMATWPCGRRQISHDENSFGTATGCSETRRDVLFKRGHPTRGNANVLFATIALQLAVNVPELNLPISRVVEANPTLVGRSLDVQLRDLIVEPCSTIECGLTRIILIDGLDECEGKDIQQDILRLLGDSVAQAPPPFRIIIASRPEPHIREVLEGSSFVGLYSPLNIDKSFEDIRAYLQSEFARIHREHSTMAAVSNPWPSPHAIERLVGKSSGYFIYASTVIKFIDDKDYRPTRRLAALEALPGPRSQSPFAALDALYRQILSETSDNPDLVPILRVICHLDFLKPWEIEELLGLESGDVELALRGLHSVIHDEQDSGLCVIHASFSDFLNDPSRAGDFYTGDVAGLEDLARLVLSELGYMYADVNKNRAPLLADSLGWRLESLLKQVPPSEDLACLFRAINPDFIHYSDLNVNVLLSWLQVSILLQPVHQFYLVL
ncbi:hypothetical protein B0H17DRAFT_681964 [Mycena rosella]|uniref:Nephrocystin 3-like N-terminal domain-containing protein n=1 Tax=Mycena rosella TaxID=1033263 RepID=A0AAD7GGA8_MYCRO|nr:hypothetical protein B0H17DRAFT_681964 [Mycena rosella]